MFSKKLKLLADVSMVEKTIETTRCRATIDTIDIIIDNIALMKSQLS